MNTESKRGKAHEYLYFSCFTIFCFCYVCIHMLYYFITFCPCCSFFLVHSGVSVPGCAHRYALEGLPPGNYDIFMQANTDAGAGAAGPITNVHIGEDGTHAQNHCTLERKTIYCCIFNLTLCVYVCVKALTKSR